MTSIRLKIIFALTGYFLFGNLIFAAQTLVVMKDGRIIPGAIYPMHSVAEQPNKQGKKTDDIERIIAIDDQLRRIYVPKNNIRDFLPDEIGASLEIFRIPQKINNSGPEIAVLDFYRPSEPFDDFGRRVLNAGGNSLVQAITEITPQYVRVQGVNLKIDMRMSPHSIPRTTLTNLIKRNINPDNLDERLRVYQFYVQAELFEQAEEELSEIIHDFQDQEATEARLDVGLRLINQLRAERLVKELELRQNSGQYRKVEKLLIAFTEQNTASERARTFQTMLRTYTDEYPQKREDLINQLRSLAEKLENADLKTEIEPILQEIEKQVNQNTLERFSEFQLSLRDSTMSDDAKLAIGLSGWLVGNTAVDDRLELAVSMFKVRKLIRKYLLEKLPNSLDAIWQEIQAEEASDPPRVAKILAMMQPPKKAPRSSPDKPYYFELSIPSYEDGQEFQYCVQLPPEYDPNRKYPTIVTLHGEKTTPQMQVDWWAGPWKKVAPQSQNASQSNPNSPDNSGSPANSGSLANPNSFQNVSLTTKSTAEKSQNTERERYGQATRFGYIVIAPRWSESGKLYDYSARSHAAVLYAMRDAMRLFSIDSDRLFLSGHSAGGDAAWDIGLAHPDLWAGIIPICGSASYVVPTIKRNAEFVPIYAIGGELDGGKLIKSAETLDWGMDQTIPFDMTYVQFKGRGNESFSDETIRLFEWMQLKKRNFSCKTERNLYSTRPWDNFFWNVELFDFPDKSLINPVFVRGEIDRFYRPAKTEFFNVYGNSIKIRSNASRGIVFLSPDLVNFDKRIDILYNMKKISPSPGLIKPSSRVMLEDVRTRADRQHPFWAFVDSDRKGEANYWDKDASSKNK
ncbi:MAG: hypothetical protein Q4C95_07500 [Planctomycetia bacterium]|nr:hypothetical protein [Planctomycetia bacterium]